MAKKYVGESAEVKELSEASSALSAASGSKDIALRLSADNRLEAAMTALYRSLEDSSLSEKDDAYRQRLYADFSSRADTISHDPYNGYAQDYNETLSRFPASLIAAVTPVKAAVIFY